MSEPTDTPPEGSQAAAIDDGTVPFLDTGSSQYKTSEDAVTGFKDAATKISAQGEQSKKDQDRIQALEDRIAQADATTQLAEAVTNLSTNAKTDPGEQARLAEEREKLYAEVDEKPSRGIEVMDDITYASEQRIKKMLQDVDDKHAKELEALRARMSDGFHATDPFNLSHKEEIQETQDEYGVSRDVAVQIVRKYSASEGEGSNIPPSNTVSNRVTEVVPEKENYISDTQAEVMKNFLGATDEELAKLDGSYK